MDITTLPQWAQVSISIGAVVVVLIGLVIGLTPSKKDDAAWEKVNAWPIVGPFLKWLMSKSPFQKKD